MTFDPSDWTKALQAKVSDEDKAIIVAFLIEVVESRTPLSSSEAFEAACEVFGLRPYFIHGGAMKPHLGYYLPDKTA